MKNPIKWLAEHSTGSADCSGKRFICGYNGLTYAFNTRNGQSDPLSIKIYPSEKKNIQCDFTLTGLANKSIHIQFIKKINKTPFFYSLLHTENLDLHIVDFYHWQEPALCIRFFYSLSFTQNVVLKKKDNVSRNTVYHLFESIHVPSANPDTKIKGYVYIISRHPIDPKYRDMSILMSLLEDMTAHCQQDHISHYFHTGDRQSMAELDWLWSQQKHINPDLSIAQGTAGHHWILIRYLAHYFGWHVPVDSSDQKLTFDRTKVAVIDIPLLYTAFIEHTPMNSSVYQQLNRWWMLYSLPLMERKFIQLMKSAPVLLTMLALLALQYQLSWKDVLVFRLLSGELDPFFRMIIWLSMRILIRENNRSLYIYPGFYWDNNMKEIQRNADEIKIKCTKYSKKQYIVVFHQKKRLYQADHRFLLVFTPDENKLAASPLIPAVTNIPADIVSISLTIGGKSLVQPLVFRKAEVYFNDLRFRWILKKRRFQVTLMRKHRDLSVVLNGNHIDFNQSPKKKIYLEASRGNHIACIALLNQRGSLLHRRRVSGYRQLMLEGWALDNNRVFYDTISYSAGYKQHAISSDSSGKITAPISISAGAKHVEIILKGIPRIEKQLAIIDDRRYGNLLFFQSTDWLYPLEISIESSLIHAIPKIRSYFLEMFAFVPEIRMNTKCNMHLTTEDRNEGVPIGVHAEKIDNILQELLENIFIFE